MTAIVLWCAIAFQFVGKPNVSPTDYQQSPDAQAAQTANLQDSQATAAHTEHADSGAPPWYTSPEWWLVGVGIFTLLAIYYQATKTADAAKATERTTVLQFRPKLAVRGITIHDWNVAPLMQEAKPRIQFSIVNTGASTAHILESKVQTYSGDSLPVPKLEAADSIGTFALRPGESIVKNVFTSGTVTLAIQWLLGRHNTFPSDEVRAGVYIAGVIRYEDETGIRRSMGFFRQYREEVRRFVLLDDADYEYQD